MRVRLLNKAKKAIAALVMAIGLTTSVTKDANAIVVVVGANTGSTTGYPCPVQDLYRLGKEQYLYRESELLALGIVPGDIITSVGFILGSVYTNSGMVNENFTLNLKSTPITTLTAMNFETGTSLFYGPTSQTTANFPATAGGYYMFPGNSPYVYTGGSLLVEVCGGTSSGSYTGNPSFQYTTVSGFNGSNSVYSDSDPLPPCTITWPLATSTYYSTAYTQRPRLVIDYLPGKPCADPSIVMPPQLNIASSYDTVCSGGETNLTIPNMPIGQGFSFEWQYKPLTSTTWTTISTTTFPIPSSVVSGTPTTQTSLFRAIVKCNNTYVATTDSVLVRALTLPNAPTGADVVRCGGGTVTLTATTSTAGAQVTWFSSTTNPAPLGIGTSFTTPLLGSSTIFYAQAIAQGNGFACKSTFTPINVTIKPLPNPSVSLSVSPSTIICANSNVTFTATPTQGGSSPMYTWYRNGVVIPGANSATYSSSNLNNNDTIWVDMIGSQDCTPTTPKSSNYFVMTVSNPGAASVSITKSPNTEICLGTPLTITALGSNTGPGATYQLRVNGLNIGAPTASNEFVYGNPRNNDQVQVIMVSNSTCANPAVATSNTLNLSVSTPVAQATVVGNDVLCGPDSVRIEANTGTNYTYQWYRNTNLIPGATDNYYYAKDSAYYSVFVTNHIGCDTLSQGVWVHVKPAPNATIASPAISTFCDSGMVILNAVMGNQNGYIYQWFRNGQPIAQNGNSWFYPVDLPGNYSLEVNGGNGCSAKSEEVSLTKYNMPPATITANGMTLSTISGYAQYDWYFGSTPLNINHFEITAPYTGYYKVIVYDANGCKRESQYSYVSGLGIDHNNISNNINVYPNPVNSIVYVETQKMVNLKLTDVTGKELINVQNTKQLNVQHLPNGIYLLSIYDQNGQFIKTEKITKQ